MWCYSFTKYNKMKLSEKCIELVSSKCELRLAITLELSQRRIQQILKENEANNQLTTEASLRVLEEETGLTRIEIINEVLMEGMQNTN